MGTRGYERRQLSSAVPEERGSSQRRLRIGEELRHAVSNILRQGACRDPALQDASLAITEVRVSHDLRTATVFVIPLGGANATRVVTALQRGLVHL